MSFEDTLRIIVREEVRSALAELRQMPAGEMVSLQEASARVNVCVSTLEKWGKQGLTIARRGKVRRVDIDELRAFMKQREAEPRVDDKEWAERKLATVAPLRRIR